MCVKQYTAWKISFWNYVSELKKRGEDIVKYMYPVFYQDSDVRIDYRQNEQPKVLTGKKLIDVAYCGGSRILKTVVNLLIEKGSAVMVFSTTSGFHNGMTYLVKVVV